MATVTVRELRNEGGKVLDRVEAGERITVTRHGRPVAELVPAEGRRLRTSEIVERFRTLPPVDPERLRADVDRIVDPDLWRGTRGARG